MKQKGILITVLDEPEIREDAFEKQRSRWTGTHWKYFVTHLDCVHTLFAIAVFPQRRQASEICSCQNGNPPLSLSFFSK